jgi:hypothetical protein
MDMDYLEKMPWFMKGSRSDAEKSLASQDPGSFVIRPSSQANCLALSHKVSNGSVGHALIHSTSAGFRLEQTQNAFPTLELLVLSIKKHFTVNDSMSSFGAGGAGAAGNASIDELAGMFPDNPRESLVAALQLAGGNTDKAAELMLNESLYTSDRDDNETAVLVKMIVASCGELSPKVSDVCGAVQRIRTYQELKQKVQLGKAVADVKKALQPFASSPAVQKARPRPTDLPPGPPGTTEEQLVRFKNTIQVSVWEVQCKLDTIAADVGKPTLKPKVKEVAAALKSVREALATVDSLAEGGAAGAGAASGDAPSGGSRAAPKTDEEFYLDFNAIKMEKEIGKGAYGKVYKGTYDNRVVAIKTIEITDPKEMVLIRREISLLRECQHPNITELLGVSKDGGETLLLVMEFVDRGELYKILLDEKLQIGWPLRLKIAHDVACGLAHVHSKNLIHRDIKSENLLVDSKWNVKLCDFGFARAVSHGLHRYTMCGSMYFNAPELLLGKPYDAKADVFAYGIFLCELITRGSINLERTKQTAFGLDVKALEKHIPADCPPLFWKVAFCACTYSPARRPTMLQVTKMLSKIMAKYPLKEVPPL